MLKIIFQQNVLNVESKNERFLFLINPFVKEHFLLRYFNYGALE